MVTKQSILKDKPSLVILLFALICFFLVLADLGNRFKDAIHAESGQMICLTAPQQGGGVNNAEFESKPAPEEFKKIIENYLRNTDGN